MNLQERGAISMTMNNVYLSFCRWMTLPPPWSMSEVKGLRWRGLAGAGLPVPPVFTLPTAAYRSFVEANGLQETDTGKLSRRLMSSSQPRSEGSIKQDRQALRAEPRCLRRLPRQFGRPIPNLEKRMAKAARRARRLLELPVASTFFSHRRRSAGDVVCGQQDTYLNMRGAAMVLDAVKRCWGSLWTARAIGYRARHNIAPDEVSLAVVVQELVPADAAGIMFHRQSD